MLFAVSSTNPPVIKTDRSIKRHNFESRFPFPHCSEERLLLHNKEIEKRISAAKTPKTGDFFVELNRLSCQLVELIELTVMEENASAT